MRTTQVKKVIAQLYASNNRRPVFLWGPPGVGKTDIVGQAARELGLTYHESNLTCHDAGDIKFPIVSGGEVSWKNSLFPESPEWRGICCLDELAQADVSVMKAVCQVVLARRIGQSVMPDGLMFVACANRQQDRAGANRVITPLLSRFIHLDVEASLEDWTEWANSSGVDHRVVSFLQWKPSLLHVFNPEENPRSFPCPRTWHMFSDALQVVSEDTLHSVAKGVVGEAAAAEVVGFLQIYDSIALKYPIDKIVNDPDSVPVPRLSEGAILWALGGALAERAKTKVRAVTHNCMRYAMRMPLEFASYAVRSIMQSGGSIDALTAPGASLFIEKNKSIILAN